jgi:hypothetical protein
MGKKSGKSLSSEAQDMSSLAVPLYLYRMQLSTLVLSKIVAFFSLDMVSYSPPDGQSIGQCGVDFFARHQGLQRRDRSRDVGKPFS